MTRAEILHLYREELITATEADSMLRGNANAIVAAYLAGIIDEKKAWEELKKCQNLAVLKKREEYYGK